MEFLMFLGQFQVTIGLLALLSIIFYLWRRTKAKQANEVLAPEVEGAWPIVGHLPQLVGPRPLFRILGDMADKYGPIFMVRFGMYPTLVVSSWEMAKECFVTNDRFLASRPASAAGRYLTYEFAMFGFSFYGPYWREIRKIAKLELLSNHRLELLKHVPFTEIDSFIKRLYRRWMKEHLEKQAGNDDDPVRVKVNMSQLFGDLTLNNVLKLVVGTGIYENYDDDLNREHEGRKLCKTIGEFFKLTGVSVASDAIPFLRWLDLDGQKRNMKRIAKEIDIIAERWLQEHRQKRLSNKLQDRNAREGDNDFMGVLLSILDDEPHFFNYSSETVVKATSLGLILAASDTTYVSLTWALALLVINPGILRKAQDELDIKVGRERHVNEQDIEQLVYLQAIVKETLRIYPAAPYAAPHEAIQDCTVAGYHVAAGTRLVVNIWKVQRDPRVWPNPSEFRPERFLPDGSEGGGGEAAHMDYKGQNFEYIPFGSGRRMCPGDNYAIQILHMTLARLLHAFELQLPSSPDGNPVEMDMTEGSGLTMPKVTPLQIVLNPRLPLPLYEL